MIREADPSTKTARIIALHREQPMLTAGEIAERVGCARDSVYWVKCRYGLAIPKESPRGLALSPEHRAKLRAAKLGRTLPAEHRAKIAAGVRRTHPKRLRTERIMAALSEQEREDFMSLTRSHSYSQAEALAAIGRGDLVGGQPA